MAGHRVKAYLEKHKIGPLFESLMAALIQDNPSDPIRYLISVLEEMHDKSRDRTRLSDKSWYTKAVQGPAPKSVDQNGSKNGKKSAISTSSGSISISPKQEPANFHTGKWKADASSSDNPLWRCDESNENKERNRNQNKPLHHVTNLQLCTDELCDELLLGKSKILAEGTPAPSRCCYQKARRKGQDHRQHLQALLVLSNNNKNMGRKPVQNFSEEGIEIFEKIEDLKEEGISQFAGDKGAKLSKVKDKRLENLTITICARCAKVIGGREYAESMLKDPHTFDTKSENDQELSKIFHASSESSYSESVKTNDTWSVFRDNRNNITTHSNTIPASTGSSQTGFDWEEGDNPKPSTWRSSSASQYGNKSVNTDMLRWREYGQSVNSFPFNSEAMEKSDHGLALSTAGKAWGISNDMHSDAESIFT